MCSRGRAGEHKNELILPCAHLRIHDCLLFFSMETTIMVPVVLLACGSGVSHILLGFVPLRLTLALWPEETMYLLAKP